MFPSAEIIEYTELLHELNQNNSRINYTLILEGGGTDGIPHFKLLKNLILGVYVIWVRGTRLSDYNDAWINIQASAMNFYNGTCHKGYLLGALGVLNQIRGSLNDNQINKIVCLGHSLGGAVSSVIATIIHRGDDANGTITGMGYFQNILIPNGIKGIVFGTPPVFSDVICNYSRNFVTNIILKKDIIPKLSDSFDALRILQNKIVSYLMFNANAIRHQPSINNQDNLKPNKLSGQVIVIDTKSHLIYQGPNLSNILHYTDLLGFFHHQMIYYHDQILLITPTNYTQNLNNGIIVVSEKSTIKKTTLIVAGTALAGFTAYLSIGASIAFGVLGAIASSI